MELEQNQEKYAYFFLTDNILINKYGKALTPYGIAIYCSIRWRTNTDDISWPSEKTIASELGISKRTVIRYLKVLIAYNILMKTRVPGPSGRWAYNVYQTVEREKWLEPDALVSPGDRVTIRAGPGDSKSRKQVPQSHTNKNQINKNQITKEEPGELKLKRDALVEKMTLGNRYRRR